MESKEHLFFMLLLLATLLAIAVQTNVVKLAGARNMSSGYRAW